MSLPRMRPARRATRVGPAQQPPIRPRRPRARRAARTGALAAVLLAACLAPLLPASPAAADDGANAVVDGSARFEVISPTVIRMEYAGDGHFEDRPTFNAVNRNHAPVAYTSTVTADGYREIRTAAVDLRYRRGSGPFGADNVTAQLTVAGQSVTVHPYAGAATAGGCAFGALCEGEAAQLTAGVTVGTDHAGFTGTGFAAGFEQTGASVTATVGSVPAAGTYSLAVRYANAAGSDGQTTQRTLTATVNGAAVGTLTLPPTGSWDTWKTAALSLPLTAGADTVKISRGAGDNGRVNIDSFALLQPGAAYPGPGTAPGGNSQLGGWYRGLDNPATLPVALHPGVLSRAGWYLLDDSRTPVQNPDGTIGQRPTTAGQPYQDGYFFGYGHDYKQALTDLSAVTGPTALLPQWAYGVWYSRYYAYTDADYRNTLLPAFRANHVPLDALVIDTDYKSPSTWDGWNWNTGLFPDPTGFMNWTKTQGLKVALNIHAAIGGNDPKFAAANATAGGLAQSGGNYVFDWSNPQQAKAYFDLHSSFEQQGVREWWLDWCCDASQVSAPDITPDAWINQLYKQHDDARGVRGFAFSRMGASYQNYGGTYPAGPWAEHRNTLQFTGDTPATWDMLAYEAQFTPDEAAIGMSNVSDDIGSFHGGHLADDLYARWVQLGTFQPVDRLHSDHGDRLPWNYGAAANASASRFLQLREALVPYTYSLARQAYDTGVPVVRPLYLDYPESDAAYTNAGEYLYGDDVLVRPVTTSGTSATSSVWIPPGTWTDYFTNTAYTGPATVQITDDLSTMPVLIRGGGILATRTDQVDNAAQRPLDQVTLDIGAGANGSFSLYEDAGDTNAFTTGQSARTAVTYDNAAATVRIAAAQGSYPGQATSRRWTVHLRNLATAPASVTVDGRTLTQGTDWTYSSTARQLTVNTASLPTGSVHTIVSRPAA
ncbi:TIM-barrel domain-containing protein [Streptomyces polygonati]|uniref:TIM-barrel domain-containing protein n=1 Tax=Streptomyces polygonati TaxID=1617087 RepID=A0ABV8HNS7_9ACTN